MLQSKALKNTGKEPSKLYLWWIETTVSDWYYDFIHKFIENPIFQVKRLYQWYKNVFRYDYDFDGHCLYAIIEYKLKRIEKILLNGHAIQEDQDVAAIQLAIKLAGRLREDKYDERPWKRMNDKWGESKHWTEPCNDGSGNHWFKSSRPKVNTPEEKEQESADFKIQYMLAEARRHREERWLYAILLKYLRRWWD